jgi:predicted GH43/DUF377 family glycosyl hydrolase
MNRHFIDFNVERITPIRVEAKGSLKGRDLMSPFVWELPRGSIHILLRGVPDVDDPEAEGTGSIYYGTSSDGIHFTMDAEPVLAPDSDPGSPDHGGCEDPTVLHSNGQFVVYYTGVERTHTHGVMLYATGPDMHHLTKRGIAHRSSKKEGNVKEATIAHTPEGKWRLFYEYAYNQASRIGLALGESMTGPWHERESPIEPRKDRWDNWHLSTGPMLRNDPDQPVMFYNGATKDARWRIGWAIFDRDCQNVVYRCIQPLITPTPPNHRSDTDIAFAASVLDKGEFAHLYYSVNDREVYMALIRRS